MLPNMSLILTGFRFVTAILSLVAVVFAVLEREDLLFSADWTAVASAPSSKQQSTADDAACAIKPPLTSEWTRVQQDCGTDGAFRQETHTFRAAPASRPAPVRPSLRAMPRRRVFARRAARSEARARPRLAGILVLRL